MGGSIPKYDNSTLSPKERAEMDNMNAQEAMNRDDDPYSALVNKLIRERYSPSHVEAIYRKKLAGIDQGDAFEAFNEFAEECKRKAKEMLGNTGN